MTRCAVAYFRTSSQTNVGGDSDRRRREAAQEYAKRAGLRIGAECYDAAMSGADPINERKGFTDLLSWARENDCWTILVESASRCVRDLIVQETGYEMLAREGFTLMAVDDPDAFTADAP